MYIHMQLPEVHEVYKVYDLLDDVYNLIEPYIGKCDKKYFSIFNPCLLHLKNSVILSMRIVANKPENDTKCELAYDPLTRDINWSRLIDSTFFFIIDNKELSLLYVNRVGDLSLSNCVDLRMFYHYENGDIYFTYNRYVTGDKIINKVDCTKLCAPLYISKVSYIEKTRVLFIETMMPLCRNLIGGKDVGPVEKNWTSFDLKIPGTFQISHWLSKTNELNKSEHIYINFDKNNYTCSEIIKKKSQHLHIEGIHISLGANCVRNSKGNIVGIGHAKGLLKDVKWIFPEQNWTEHYNTARNFAYVMFFYEMDNDGNVIKHSNFFIPPNLKDYRKLYFPTGLLYTNDSYFISYGQSDKYSYILKLPEKKYYELFEDIDIDNLIILPTEINNQDILDTITGPRVAVLGGGKTRKRKNKKKINVIN